MFDSESPPVLNLTLTEKPEVVEVVRYLSNDGFVILLEYELVEVFDLGISGSSDPHDVNPVTAIATPSTKVFRLRFPILLYPMSVSGATSKFVSFALNDGKLSEVTLNRHRGK